MVCTYLVEQLAYNPCPEMELIRTYGRGLYEGQEILLYISFILFWPQVLVGSVQGC